MNKVINYIDFDTSKNWLKDFPTEKWSLIILANVKNVNYFEEIIRKSIDRNVCYITAVGKQHNLIHDIADEEISIRIAENQYLPEHIIMTVGEEDFEEGLWFGIYCAFNYETDIEQIVIIDTDKDLILDAKILVEKFNNGYLPTEK